MNEIPVFLLVQCDAHMLYEIEKIAKICYN